MNRRHLTADAFLLPHNEHIVVLPVAVFQLLLHLFGMGSARPEFVALTAFLLSTAALVFVYVGRRVGPWPALMATTVLLFLGPAWQDLLWPFQIGLVGSVLCGVAMLLALERDDERGDLAACVLLALSVFFSSLGLSFVVAAFVDLLQRRGARGLRRAYVVALPLLLYAAWYLGWGHDAETHLTLHNVLVSPRFVGQSVLASVDSLLALGTIAGEVVGRSKWGVVVLAASAVLIARAWRRGRRFDAGLWPALAAAASFWLLAAFNYIPGREAYSSRYIYVGGVFVVLIAANLLRGMRFGRLALAAGAGLTAVVVGFNLVPLREGRDFLREQTVLTRSDLAALEIARRTVDPALTLTPEVAGTSYLVNVQAGAYLQAMREYGSPAYSPAELAAAPETGRSQADVLLANALPLAIEFEATGVPRPIRDRCARVGAGMAALPLHPGVTAIELPPGGPAKIRLQRFARREFPLASQAGAGTVTLLRIPADAASRPWLLRVDSPRGARVCGGISPQRARL